MNGPARRRFDLGVIEVTLDPSGPCRLQPGDAPLRPAAPALGPGAGKRRRTAMARRRGAAARGRRRRRVGGVLVPGRGTPSGPGHLRGRGGARATRRRRRDVLARLTGIPIRSVEWARVRRERCQIAPRPLGRRGCGREVPSGSNAKRSSGTRAIRSSRGGTGAPSSRSSIRWRSRSAPTPGWPSPASSRPTTSSRLARLRGGSCGASPSPGPSPRGGGVDREGDPRGGADRDGVPLRDILEEGAGAHRSSVRG